MKTIPKTGELYKDSTNNIYQVITVAVHAETGEQIVVYQAMSVDYRVYARSLQQFTGEGNRQQLFQKIERTGYQTGNLEGVRAGYQPEGAEDSRAEYQPENAEDSGTGYQSGNAEGAADRQLAESQQYNTMYSKAEAESAYGPKQQAENSWKPKQQTGNSRKPEQQTGNSRKPEQQTGNNRKPEQQTGNNRKPEQQTGNNQKPEQQTGNSWMQEQQPGYASRMEPRPRTQSPAESRRALRQSASETSGEGSYYYEKRRRQMEEREQRREMFRKTERHESATEELRANPCLMKFLEADTYEEKFHVLNEIQNDITDRLIDDIAVVLDVVIPEGALNDRFQQLRNIILTRQKYEINRFR